MTHQALGSQAIARHGPALAKAMRRFIDGARRFVAPGDREPHSAALAHMIDDLDDAEAKALRRVMDDRDPAALDRLPHVSQHGDLVINNLGRAARGMVIFDWEDFGRVTLPGFDVARLDCCRS